MGQICLAGPLRFPPFSFSNVYVMRAPPRQLWISSAQTSSAADDWDRVVSLISRSAPRSLEPGKRAQLSRVFFLDKIAQMPQQKTSPEIG
jgi:hypothetical protein